MSARSLIPLVLALFARLHLDAQSTPSEVAALADSSALVLAGRVDAVAVGEDAGSVYTYATVRVYEVFKGPLPADTVVVKVLGGTLPDLGLWVADQAAFEAGEDVLLFLAPRPRDGSLYTVGLARGKWQVLPDLSTGGRVALLGGQRVTLDRDFRESAALSRPHASGFVAAPPEAAIARPAYTFIPPEDGGPARWHEADDGARIPIDYQTVPGGLPGNGVDQLDAAIGIWNGVNTTLELERAFTGPHTCPARNFIGNGRIALYWNDPCGEVSDGDAQTFGVGGGFFTPGFQKTINGVTFNKFLQGLAILNNVGPHLASTACLEAAVVHVLGHTVGLGHSSDGGAAMFATLRSGCPSGLGNDDRDGLRAIYPAMPSGGLPPDAPTAITNAVVLDTVTLSWTPATTGGSAQSYVLEAGVPPNVLSIPLNSANTSVVIGGVPPGVYPVRVRARNALGTSGPSPDTTVTVGPCQAPGVPAAFSYTTADNFVSLTWSAPVTGITQGYWLYAGSGPRLSDLLVLPLGPTPAFSGLAPYGTYYVRVAARNSCATGPPTADLLVSVQPCTAPPNAATGLVFTLNGNVVSLAWNAPSTGNLPSTYQIHVGATPGASDFVFPLSNNATSFVAAAPPGHYFVRIVGRNNCGLSPASNEVEILVR